MDEHLSMCPYSQPCPEEWRNERTIQAEGLPVPHRIVSGSSGRCVECSAGECICDIVLDERKRILEAIDALMPKDRHRDVRWLIDEFAIRRIINEETE